MPRKTAPAWETEKDMFPTRLRELMEERSTTQAKLAEAIGKRPQTVSLYTTGQSVPDVNCLREIAQYFNVSADWLIGRSGAVKTLDSNIAVAALTTGLTESAVQKIQDSYWKTECSYLAERGYLEDVARCIGLYKEHLFFVYKEDYETKIAAEKAKEDGAVFIDLQLERSRYDAERRGYKADLIELALKITQGIDNDFRGKYGDDQNGKH